MLANRLHVASEAFCLMHIVTNTRRFTRLTTL